MHSAPTPNSWIEELGRYWDVGGTLWNIRNGIFDGPGLRKLESTLHNVSLADEATIAQELVSLLWYSPLVLIWNKDRIELRWRSELESQTEQIEGEVRRILGDPRKTEVSPKAAVTKELLAAWKPGGFFSELGRGIVDLSAAKKVKEQVATSLAPKQLLERSFVTAIWYNPVFLERYLQEHELRDVPETMFALREIANALHEETAAILGIP